MNIKFLLVIVANVILIAVLNYILKLMITDKMK